MVSAERAAGEKRERDQAAALAAALLREKVRGWPPTLAARGIRGKQGGI